MVFLPWLFGICTTQSLNSHGQVLTTTSTAKTKTTNYKLTLSELHFRRHKFYVRRHDRANKKNTAKSASFWDVHSSDTLSKLIFLNNSMPFTGITSISDFSFSSTFLCCLSFIILILSISF